MRALVIAALVASPALAQELTATIEKIERKVEVQRGGGQWEPAVVKMQLAAGDKIHTGFKATATVKMADGSKIDVKPMSLVMLQKLEDPDGKVKNRIWLRAGELSATVDRPTGAPADFEVRTTTATASVRGTDIRRIACWPGIGTRIQMGGHGRIAALGDRRRAHLSRRQQTQSRGGGGPLTPEEMQLREQQADVQPGGTLAEEQEEVLDTGVPKTNPLNTGGSGLASQALVATENLLVEPPPAAPAPGGGGAAPGVPTTRTIVPIPVLP